MGYIVSIVCLKCGEVIGSCSFWGTHYHYKKADGELFEIYPKSGWCWNCGRLQLVQEGLTKTRLESKIAQCRQDIEKLHLEYADCIGVKAPDMNIDQDFALASCGITVKTADDMLRDKIRNYEWRRLSSKFSMEENEKLLDYIQDRTSLNQCLHCLNCVADEDLIRWDDTDGKRIVKNLRHPGCGGTMTCVDTDMHILFEERDAVIEPLWAGTV